MLPWEGWGSFPIWHPKFGTRTCSGETLVLTTTAGQPTLFSLGVCLFTLLTGFHPFEKHEDQRCEVLLRDGVKTLMACFGLADKVSPLCLDLLDGMLRLTKARVDIDAVLSHPALVALNTTPPMSSSTTPVKNEPVAPAPSLPSPAVPANADHDVQAPSPAGPAAAESATC